MSIALIDKPIAAIDIGTTKIVVIIAKKQANRIEILGVGQAPSHGLKKGVIVNINATVESIKAALNQAQSMAGITIESACVGISGGHISSINSTGVVAVKSKLITQNDIDRVVEAAKAIPIQKDHYILHVLPQYFQVDSQENVLDSLGMYGVRLEAHVHIITGAVSSAQNIIKACELADIKVSDIILEQLASAAAVLTPAEQEMGVGILDIGGGTSDFAIYKDGRIRHSKVFPVAGNHFTNDISIGLMIPGHKAEDIKKQYGRLLNYTTSQTTQHYLDVELGYDGGIKTININAMIEILHFRAEEIFDLLSEEIYTNKLIGLMPSGLVLTGGGTLLPGMQDLAMEKLNVSSRIGYPLDTTIQQIPDILRSPIYSTAYGLLLYASGISNIGDIMPNDAYIFSRVLKRMRSWIYELF